MIDFLKTYWKELTYGVGVLIVIIITLIPKKVKVLDTIKTAILEQLPHFISMVERPGDGKAKLQEVVQLCVAFLCKAYPGVQVSQYMSFIRSSVEAILSTPTKKVR